MDSIFKQIARRRFIQDAAMTAAVTYLSPGLLIGCDVESNTSAVSVKNSGVMDSALDRMARLAPLGNHGPMAAEALVKLGCEDQVLAFVEAYKKRFTLVYPEVNTPITQENWNHALGVGARFGDWSIFFQHQLKEAPWQQVLDHWCKILAPGLSAAAAHGLIRTAHAARSLSVDETDLRRRELAEGLAYWAAYYQTLPEVNAVKAEKFKPSEAINHIPVLPAEKRVIRGSIMNSLRNLDHFPAFANAIHLVEESNSPQQFLSEVTETFATAYVKNVNSQNHITLIHTVTGTTAVRSLIPYVSVDTTQKLLRYGWQVAAALYSISASGSKVQLAESDSVKPDNLIDRAVDMQEEHAIKFTEACLREHALNPKPVYLQAAADAITRL